MAIITPYDNKIALWHHKGQAVAEATIDDLALTIRRYAPAVSQVWVKTSDGSELLLTLAHVFPSSVDFSTPLPR